MSASIIESMNARIDRSIANDVVRADARTIARSAGSAPFAGSGTYDAEKVEMSVSSIAADLSNMAASFLSSIADRMYYMSDEDRMSVLSEMVNMSEDDGHAAFVAFITAMGIESAIANMRRMGH